MRKLTRLNIDALQREMPVLDEETLRSIYGGLDPNDCWWRCMAYISSNGQNYSADAAMGMASSYYGSSFDSSSYAFSGNAYDARAIASGVLGGAYTNSHQILVFNPSTLAGWEGNGSSHAVVVKGYSNGVYTVFDPQNGEEVQISAFNLNNASGYFV